MPQKLTDAARQRAYAKIAQGGTSSYFPDLTAGDLAVSPKTGKYIQRARAQQKAGAGFVPRAGAGFVPRAGAGIFEDIGRAVGLAPSRRGKRGKRGRSQQADFTALADATRAFAPLVGVAAGNPQAGIQASQAIGQLQSTAAGRRAIAGRASAGEQLALAGQFSPQLLAAAGHPAAARAAQLAQTQDAMQLAANPEFMQLAAQARGGSRSSAMNRRRRVAPPRRTQKKGGGVSRPGRR